MRGAVRDRGIVVLGFPRSGTSLVRRLLNAHPRICCPPETNLLRAAGRFMSETPFAGGLSVGPLSGLAFSGLPAEEILDRLRALVFGIFEKLATAAGKPIWAEKTAFDSFHVDAIERLCGERCRYVLIVRHPLDTVCSVGELCERMGTYLPELHEYVRRHPSPLTAFAHAWCDVNRRLDAFRQQHVGYCVLVRYEDLAAHPGREVARMFDELGEPVEAEALLERAMAESVSVGLGDWKVYETWSVHADSIDRWRKLDAAVVAGLAEIVGPVMTLLGYPPLEVEPPADAATARHLYQVRRMAARAQRQRQPQGQQRDKS